ncbi:MAG: hypothetical protein DRJ47_06715 [Thermoprotei archaeon]|nr:MAG: hypothetical protein DRJ47_06715 [Thermoprotei archaeon]
MLSRENLIVPLSTAIELVELYEKTTNPQLKELYRRTIEYINTLFIQGKLLGHNPKVYMDASRRAREKHSDRYVFSRCMEELGRPYAVYCPSRTDPIDIKDIAVLTEGAKMTVVTSDMAVRFEHPSVSEVTRTSYNVITPEEYLLKHGGRRFQEIPPTCPRVRRLFDIIEKMLGRV